MPKNVAEPVAQAPATSVGCIKNEGEAAEPGVAVSRRLLRFKSLKEEVEVEPAIKPPVAVILPPAVTVPEALILVPEILPPEISPLAARLPVSSRVRLLALIVSALSPSVPSSIGP